MEEEDKKNAHNNQNCQPGINEKIIKNLGSDKTKNFPKFRE